MTNNLIEYRVVVSRCSINVVYNMILCGGIWANERQTSDGREHPALCDGDLLLHIHIVFVWRCRILLIFSTIFKTAVKAPIIRISPGSILAVLSLAGRSCPIKVQDLF